MQISALLNIAPLLSIGEINVPLPMDDEAWNAPHSRPSMHTQRDGPHFRAVLDSLLTRGKLPQPVSSFALSIIAYTLYRCVTSCVLQSLNINLAVGSAPMPLRSIPYFRSHMSPVIRFTDLRFPLRLSSRYTPPHKRFPGHLWLAYRN